MNPMESEYSPNILIYLQIGQRKIRLADVLEGTATLYEPEGVEVSADTSVELVFLIDSAEERQNIVLHEGISRNSELISFSYVNGTNDCSNS